MAYPILYEINTRCWLRELTERYGRQVTLASVPDEEFKRWQRLGFTHLWLMGVWTTGPRARALAERERGLWQAYDQALPGWQKEDVAGSPYAIAGYQAPPVSGGESGLATFRRKLNNRGLKLVLDFVPNHVGLDHPWLEHRPELFVQSSVEAPETFPQETVAGVRWLAHGKDPNYAAWTDTAQLDYRRSTTRAAMLDVLRSVAARCDGVRCDMAMLVLNDVFARTWAGFPMATVPPASGDVLISVGQQAGSRVRSPHLNGKSGHDLASEFWAEAISRVRAAHPGFQFVAEVYWGLESRLQELGFNYTYDKRLYDEIVQRKPGGPQRRLSDMPRERVNASVHFLENHDEPRVASLLSPAEHRAAALVILGLPGMRFLHDGQLTGATTRVPVQLARCRSEPVQPEIARLYEELLQMLARTAVGQGTGRVLAVCEAWPGNSTARNFVIVQWQVRPPGFDLVVVNLGQGRSQCIVPLTVPDLSACNWSMSDLLGNETYERSGADLERPGLYLDVPAHGAQLFHFTPLV